MILYSVSIFFYPALSLCVSLFVFYPDVPTRPGTVGIGAVCVLACVMRLSKLSRPGQHRDMTWNKPAGWKHTDSLSSFSDTTPPCLFIQKSVCCGRGSLPHPSLLPLSLSLFILLCRVSPPHPPFSHSLTPSLLSFSTECHRVSVWGITDRSGILPLLRPALNYSWQHRACFSV